MATQTMSSKAEYGSRQVEWTVERALRLIAGLLIMISMLLGVFVHPYWHYFTLFVGANLFQSAFTSWCPMMTILRWAGLR